MNVYKEMQVSEGQLVTSVAMHAVLVHAFELLFFSKSCI